MNLRSKRKLLLSLVLILSVTCSTMSPIMIPLGKPIVLDGNINEKEWSDASKYMLVNGGELFIKQNGKNILIAINGPKLGWVHICIKTDDLVLVLHSSAALGIATYHGEEAGLFTLQSGFKWEMRNPDQTIASQKQRNNYLESNKWIASTAWMGNPDEREFIINKDIIEIKMLRIGIVYAADVPEPDFYYWPEKLSDDSLNKELVYGSAPDRLFFKTEDWAILSFINN